MGLSSTFQNNVVLDHKNIPFSPAWVVARKSPAGENDTDVGILETTRISINDDVGNSQVRIVESNDDEMSHLQSGEKVISVILPA